MSADAWLSLGSIAAGIVQAAEKGHDMNLTDQERGVMRHTLGLDRAAESYRNTFCAGDDHDERPILAALCERGLMRPYRKINDGRDTLFCVTQSGRDALESAR